MTATSHFDGPVPIWVFPSSEQTAWYSIRRLRAEGGYVDVTFDGEPAEFAAEDGPLRGTRLGRTSVWCAVINGALNVAPRHSDEPPIVYADDMRVRGSYILTPAGRIEWVPSGEPWNDDEIIEHRLLSNLAYKIYARVTATPRHILYFGAGASYGSDNRRRRQEGQLPPLGDNLFRALHTDPALTYWPKLPEHVAQEFAGGFEAGMLALEQVKELEAGAWDRDLELALYFSRFRPTPKNLYGRLARRCALKMPNGWTGAAITLNYERLLEESFMRNELFTPVKGVTWYDEPDGRMPRLRGDQLFEIVYPHGACQFWLGQSTFELTNGGKVIWGETARSEGNVGATHVLNRENIPIACERYQLPLICRYEPSKRPAIGSYFIDTQRQRARELVMSAETVTLVGIRCTYPNDMQVWGPLGETSARILYVEPNKEAAESFTKWATKYGKIDRRDYSVASRTFDDAFELISRFNRL